MANGKTSRSGFSSTRSSFRAPYSNRSQALSSLPSERSSTPFLDTMRSYRILEEERLESRPGTGRSERSTRRSRTPSTRRSGISARDKGTNYYLNKGVKRAMTPSEKEYLPSNFPRHQLPMTQGLLHKSLAPGVQLPGVQRGAGEQGAMLPRDKASCINFDPCETTKDHTVSVEHTFINREAIGCPPSRASRRGKVMESFDGTFKRDMSGIPLIPVPGLQKGQTQPYGT